MICSNGRTLKIERDRAATVCDLLVMPKLAPAQIKIALGSVPAWKNQGAAITRTYQFKDFPAAIKFVNAVAKLAEKAWHHPDIRSEERRVGKECRL